MSHDGKPVIGEHNLGESARKQLEEARRDPRLDRGRGASVADFWAAVEEAERVRMLGIWGLYELQRSLENEEAKLGVSRDDPNLDDSVTKRLQAASERAELARSDHEAGHAGLNAQCLVSQVSALDALVEEFAPAMREIQVAMIADQMTKKAAEEQPEAAAALSPEVHAKIGEVVRKQLANMLPKLKSLKNKGARRYEKLLAGVGLAAPVDRQIPQDLDQAIAEMAHYVTHSCIGQRESTQRHFPMLHHFAGRKVSSCASPMTTIERIRQRFAVIRKRSSSGRSEPGPK
jgi:hypothetical protein